MKNPLDDAIRETLKSDNYRFDDRQFGEFQEMVESGKIRLVFIMDSYDELSNKYLKQNLYATNKLEKWGYKDIKNYPKVITTTRNEIFSSDTEYMSWFWSEESKFKEVKLENFNVEDRINFLK